MNNDTPKEGDLKVWWQPQAGAGIPNFEVKVADPYEGAAILKALANYDLFQLKHNVKPSFINTGGLIMFDNGDWYDWECPKTYESDLDQWVEDNPRPTADASSEIPTPA